MRRLFFIASVATLSFLPACATQFHGSPNISPSECNRRCTDMRGVMAAYVYMGNYSTACVCEPATERADSAGGRAGGVAGAVAGVWMQMQAAAEQHRQQEQRRQQ